MAAFRKDSEEDDDYWSSSKVKKNTLKIFDDDVTIQAAEDLARQKKLLRQDDIEEEVINWDDTPVDNKRGQTSPEYAAPKPATSLPSSRSARNPPHMTHTRSQSETFGIPATVSFHPPSSDSKLGQVQYSKSHERLQTITNSHDSSHDLPLEDKIPSSKPKGGQDSEEIQYLRRALKRAEQLDFSVDSTIRKMLQGKPYILEVYRSKEEKLQLLDKALQVHDGNAITAIILFMRQTMKPSLFNLELQRRPEAVNHYISYLRAHYDFKDLADFLGMLNRTEEVAVSNLHAIIKHLNKMLRYKQAISANSAAAKISSLRGCLKAHFLNEPELSYEANLVEQHASILERQRPIEDADAKAEAEGNVVFKQYPRKASIIDMPVITTLYYCCFYHCELTDNNLASPLAIKKQHQLTDKQYVWTALAANSRRRLWTAIEKLLTAKGWFGNTKSHAVIGFDKVCEILNKTSAPLDVLSKYLRLIDNAEKRMNLAKKFKCHDIVVDTLVSLRDRAELTQYASKLPPGSRESYYAQDALKTSTVKWKT